MISEVYVPAPGELQAAQFVGLLPEQQRGWLVRHALQISDEPYTRAEAAQLLPQNSPLVANVYEQTRAVSGRNFVAMLTLADISNGGGPYAEASWQDALRRARGIGEPIGFGAYRPFSLEALAKTQTDPTRLQEIASAAKLRSRHERILILSAVGKQQAHSGDIEAALATRKAAKDRYYTDAADEISLAIMDNRFENNDPVGGWQSYGQLAPHLRPWGILKLRKHMPDGNYTSTYSLEECWQRYNIRQQGEIISDLLALGEYSRATELAWRMATPPYNHYTEQREQSDTIIRIAQHQAKAGDIPGGLATLDTLRNDAEAKLSNAIAEAINLPAEPANENGRMTNLLDENQFRQQEYMKTINEAQAHTIGLRVRQSARFALQQLNTAMFYGDDHLRIGEVTARQIVANAFADAGLLKEAVTVVFGIEDHSHPGLREKKAQALLGIAAYTGRKGL